MSTPPELPKMHIYDRINDVACYTSEQMSDYGDARAAYARKQALEEVREAVHCIALVRVGTALECEATIGRIK